MFALRRLLVYVDAVQFAIPWVLPDRGRMDYLSLTEWLEATKPVKNVVCYFVGAGLLGKPFLQIYSHHFNI